MNTGIGFHWKREKKPTTGSGGAFPWKHWVEAEGKLGVGWGGGGTVRGKRNLSWLVN